MQETGEYDIVVPKRVDESWNLLPKDIPHFRAKRSIYSNGQQHLRNTSVGSVNSTLSNSLYVGSTVFYLVEAFGLQFFLELSPLEDFISPGLVVQYVENNHTWREENSGEELKDCFYHGSVHGSEDSTVTVSTCHSLVSGSIQRGWISESHS